MDYYAENLSGGKDPSTEKNLLTLMMEGVKWVLLSNMITKKVCYIIS